VDPKKPARTVVALRNGLYLLTTVTEVTEGELRALGIPVPAPEPEAGTPPVDRRQPPAVPHPPRIFRDDSTPFGRCMKRWRELYGGFDRRLPERLPAWLDEFGVDTVLDGIGAISTPSPEPKYVRLSNWFRHKRDERGSHGEE
jgi:hypothetical protein